VRFRAWGLGCGLVFTYVGAEDHAAAAAMMFAAEKAKLLVTRAALQYHWLWLP